MSSATQPSPTIVRPITRHRLTRLGIQVMLIAVFGLIGGALNGLNLLIVVAAIGFGGLIMQWRISRSMIDFVDVQRRLPSEIFAGKPARLRYQVKNRHRLRPLWLLRIDDVIRSAAGKPGRQTIRTGVGMLAAGQSTSSFADITVRRRGRYALGPYRTSSITPLALSTAWHDEVSVATSIDVYPKLLRLQSSWRSRLPTRVGSVTANSQRQGAADDVFFGLREYRRGDSPKHIHWRTTARIGQPAVRQFEQQRRLDLCLLVDAHRFENAHDDDVETAISLAATIAVELSGGLAALAVVAVAGQMPDAVASGSSREGLRRVLQMLARAEATSAVDLDAALRHCLELSHHRPDLVVISTRSQAEALVHADALADRGPTLGEASLLRQWQRRSRITWVNVADRDVTGWIADAPSAKTATGLAPLDSSEAAER